MAAAMPVEAAATVQPNAVPNARGRAAILLLPTVGTLVVLFVAPLAIMFGYSLRHYTGTMAGPVTYTIENYTHFLADAFYIGILGRTLFVSAVVATISVIIAYPLAYTLARSQSRWKPLLIVIILLPLITNLVVRNYGWMVLLSQNGLLNVLLESIGLPKFTLMFTTTGVIIALTQVLAPYAVFSLYGVIQQISPQHEESVRALGGNSFHVIKDVLIPLSAAGLGAGWLLIFVQAMAAFATPMLIGGGGRAGQLVAAIVFQEAHMTLNWPFAAAISFALTVIVLMLIGIQGWLLRGHRR
jgi:putative spermidine/putrescine transport system permease protein